MLNLGFAFGLRGKRKTATRKNWAPQGNASARKLYTNCKGQVRLRVRLSQRLLCWYRRTNVHLALAPHAPDCSICATEPRASHILQLPVYPPTSLNSELICRLRVAYYPNLTELFGTDELLYRTCTELVGASFRQEGCH